MARATGSCTISFGLISIPCKTYTACVSEKASFHMINAKTNNRLKQQYVDAVTGELVARDETLKGFEHAKDQCVIFTNEEVKALESGRTNVVDILEFVPLDSVDLIAVEKSYYLGPDKGGDKAYTLLSRILVSKGVVAVGRWSTRGKDELVLVRSYRQGLVIHQMYYKNETRSFDEVASNFAKVNVSDRELDLAGKLIDQLASDAYDCGKYHDEYVERVQAAVQQKLAGNEIVTVESEPKVAVTDLFAALEASIKAQKKTGT